MIDLNTLDRRSATSRYQAAYDVIKEKFKDTRALVIGAGGSIGSAVSTLLAEADLEELTLLDCSENNLVEIVRKIRSSEDFNAQSFSSVCLDINTDEFFGSLRGSEKISTIF